MTSGSFSTGGHGGTMDEEEDEYQEVRMTEIHVHVGEGRDIRPFRAHNTVSRVIVFSYCVLDLEGR